MHFPLFAPQEMTKTATGGERRAGRRCTPPATVTHGPAARRNLRPRGRHQRRRSVALATFAMIAANGGMARATPDMMTAASTE